MAEYEASISHTPRQLQQLKDAAVCDEVTLDANDPFSIVLLDAIKGNSNCTSLQVEVTREKNPRIFLDALAHFLVAHPLIGILSFSAIQSTDRSAYNDSVRDDGARDDYAALIAAMVGSQSLHMICMTGSLNVTLEKGVMEVLKQKSTAVTCLVMFQSSFIARHPIVFGDMLATTKSLQILLVDATEVMADQPYDRSHIRNGLRIQV